MKDETMRRASIAEVKNHLSGYIHDVRGGEQIVVTSRGKSVAKLVPFDPGEELGVELNEHELQMVRDGRLTLPKKKWDPEAFLKLPMSRVPHNLPNPIVQEREEGF